MKRTLKMHDHVLMCKLEGAATTTELLETHISIFRDFNFTPDIYEYWDVSGITDINIPFDEYENLIANIRKVRLVKSKRKALFCKTDLQFGMVRSYYTLADDLYNEYSIFKTYEKLSTYINLPIDVLKNF
jgi:hypothetical protein